MKRLSLLLMVCFLGLGLAFADVVERDLTAPGDEVIGLPNDDRWPSGEAPQYGIDDNINTKYLHYDYSDTNISGIAITPWCGASVVKGLAFTSANDAADRDPTSYELYGSNDSADSGPWTLISSGSIPDFIAVWPRLTPTTTPMRFDDNDESYLYYKLMFPTNRGSTLFQIAEIELLGTPLNGWPPVVSVVPTNELVNLSEGATASFDATVEDYDSTTFTYAWSQVSGPANVDFGGMETSEDPTVTFPAVKGNYFLQVVATDDTGNVSKPVEVHVRVWDPAIDEAMIGHWAFNEGPGNKVVYNATGSDDRGILGNYLDEHTDPNFITGWIPSDGENNYALEFIDGGFVEVYPDANSVTDPNMMNLQAGISVAAWVNIYDWTSNTNRRICQFGNNEVNTDDDNIFRLLLEWGEFKFDVAPGRPEGSDITLPVFESNEWHHVAASYDGKTIKVYYDGVEMVSDTSETVTFMRDYTSQVLTIGAKNKLVNFVDYPGDYMYGAIDDFRLYSYAISQDSVRSLVQLGQNSAPVIASIVAPESVILTGTTVIDLNAVVYDAHGDALTYLWEQIEPDPDENPSIITGPTDTEDTQITISEEGTYTLKLTVNDAMYGLAGQIYKEVTIVAENASCEKVIADGLGMVTDLNEDCYINLEDLAMMAADWLMCNIPGVEGCFDPYEDLAPVIE